jgi:MerR family transcriptional regulator, copper efflux regulator
MVQGQRGPSVLISDFARAAGLTVDTVNFYVREGLLTPTTNGKGGRNPYRSFSEADLVTARFIRLSQSFGFKLSEIAAINEERQRGCVTPERSVEIMSNQLAAIDGKLAELNQLAAYLRAKIDWTKAGRRGDAPVLPSNLA